MNPVIIAAAQFEMDPLLKQFQQFGFHSEGIPIGIGALSAAKISHKLRHLTRNKDVIFIGTCGSFSPFDHVYLVRISEVFWSPTCERMGFSYSVKNSAPPIKLPEPLKFFRDLPVRKALCSPGVSLVNCLPKGFDANEAVENLELYSCADDLLAEASSLTVILAVTNIVGPDSHNQWQKNFRLAAESTASFILEKMNNFNFLLGNT